MAVKTHINNESKKPTYKEGGIYWVSIGENIGFEQDGKGDLYTRPVLVIKGISRHLFVGLPLTSQPKQGNYFYPLGMVGEKFATALLLQVRTFDVARLSNNARMISRISFVELQQVRAALSVMLLK
ncbi:type II toxin-antitoxin system PemK/MazF family toxin [Candidatus Saccharibacteria bacterium]|nr:type II toxin-antitoxin system PemK/MazF family toxin [Candidatus Saccharibacteria bacterium]